MNFSRALQRGFTLPELLVAGALVGVMIVVAALLAHPRDYSPEKRNAERWAAISLQMQVMKAYASKEGALPEVISGEQRLIGSEEGMVDLCPALVPGYMKELPYDPSVGAMLAEATCLEDDVRYITGFTIKKAADNSVTIAAPAAEGGEEISLTRQF
ncbi:MAG TPA: prepilin-type N-terminal cleavage/methylation domain-containing protein [Candidatus Saccharimonadales bacterium]